MAYDETQMKKIAHNLVVAGNVCRKYCKNNDNIHNVAVRRSDYHWLKNVSTDVDEVLSNIFIQGSDNKIFCNYSFTSYERVGYEMLRVDNCVNRRQPIYKSYTFSAIEEVPSFLLGGLSDGDIAKVLRKFFNSSLASVLEDEVHSYSCRVKEVKNKIVGLEKKLADACKERDDLQKRRESVYGNWLAVRRSV